MIETGFDVTSARHEIVIHDKVRAGFDWMTITVAMRLKEASDHPTCYGLALSITSSFGSFGFEWPRVDAADLRDPKTSAVAFLSGMDREALFSAILQHDIPVADFEASISVFRKLASDALEDMPPSSMEAQEFREALLRIEESLERIGDDWSEDNKIEYFLSQPDIDACIPDAWSCVPQTGPSQRRRTGEAFHAKLWLPYMAHLAQQKVTPLDPDKLAAR